MSELCLVPGCRGETGDGDCCADHCRQLGGAKGTYRPNDGVIDFVAVDVVAKGLRVVPLTWVEAEIAMAKMLACGISKDEIYVRLGFQVNWTPSRRARIDSIIQGLQEEEKVA